ncbi:MAG: prepilin-type N-terminal cleavage/methylation domain-containing protein [Planctomycetes bacterium]|nr:prepilin-type N-terminal cleavage/methylation domain-containing protein [Planctomycetota bacterium]
MLRHLSRRRTASGFTLIELLVVIAIIGVLAALLLPALTAVKCRSKESASQAMIRDMETAIKAYESDYGRYPGARDTTTTINPNIEADNRGLVACLATRGPRGTAYYGFRQEAMRGQMPNTTLPIGTGAGTNQYASFPMAMTPNGIPDGQGPTPGSAFPSGAAPAAGSDWGIHNVFYRNPGIAYNRLTGYELWSGGCTTNSVATPVETGSLAAAGAPSVDAQYGGAGQGRYYTKINNWR